MGDVESRVGWVEFLPRKWESIPSSAVWHLAGVYSDRPKSEVIVVVVVVVQMLPMIAATDCFWC